jgi:hypothetical protein
MKLGQFQMQLADRRVFRRRRHAERMLLPLAVELANGEAALDQVRDAAPNGLRLRVRPILLVSGDLRCAWPKFSYHRLRQSLSAAISSKHAAQTLPRRP